MSATAGLLAASALCATEGWLRRRNPYRLESAAFDEGVPIVSHPIRGWTGKRDFVFDYHHRHLGRSNRVTLNALGVHAGPVSEFKRRAVPRILLLGGSEACGWEHPVEATLASSLARQLSEKFGREVEVIDASMRHYGTRQLYHWFDETLAGLRADVVVYGFSDDHRPRNVTIHEPGKPIRLTQPIDWKRSDGAWELREKRPRDPGDWVFLDAEGRVVFRPGRTRHTPRRWLRRNIHAFCAVEENLKRERRAPRSDLIPGSETLTEALLERLSDRVREASARLLVVPHLERRTSNLDLASVCERKRMDHFATSDFASSRDVRRETLYIHPKFRALSRAGIEFYASAIAAGIAQKGLVPVQ